MYSVGKVLKQGSLNLCIFWLQHWVKFLRKWRLNVFLLPMCQCCREILTGIQIEVLKWHFCWNRTIRWHCICASTGRTTVWPSPRTPTCRSPCPATLPTRSGCPTLFWPTTSTRSCTMWRRKIRWSDSREMAPWSTGWGQCCLPQTFFYGPGHRGLPCRAWWSLGTTDT